MLLDAHTSFLVSCYIVVAMFPPNWSGLWSVVGDWLVQLYVFSTSGTSSYELKLTGTYISVIIKLQAEVNFLGQLHHPNLVKLIGYCHEDDQRLLVYEFMPRGSLENHLFRSESI